MTGLYCLALAAFFEARDVPDQLTAMAAVKGVVLARVADPRWPDDACGVVFDDRQFAWTSDGLSDDPTTHTAPADRLAWKVAQTVKPLAVTSTHFHDTSEHPFWADVLVFDGQIGNLKFYTE